jgi:hypothetical protein
MGVRTSGGTPSPRPRPPGPGLLPGLVVSVVAFALLVANGRAIGTPDLSGFAGFILRAAAAVVSLIVPLGAGGGALVGKAAAALAAAAAAGFLFAAVATRRPTADARWAGLVLALGTTLAAASQSWSGEAPSTAAVAVALWLLARAEADGTTRPAVLAGLPLGLAVGLQPSTVALALVLVGAGVVRWGRSGLLMLACAVPGSALALVAGAPAGTPDVGPAPGPLALFVSPGKGALVFAPAVLVAAVGLVRELRRSGAHRLWDQPAPGRFLPVSCAVAVAVHFASVAVVGGWAEGVFWGPRLLAPAWPLLLVFLPEGLTALGVVGTLLCVVSVLVQGLGALAYDGRWDRLRRDASGGLGAAVWDVEGSPFAFELRDRVVRLSLPVLDQGHLTVRSRAIALKRRAGSFVSFGKQPVQPTGAERTMTGFHLEGGARVAAGTLELRSAGDGFAFEVWEAARPRGLEIRIVGRGQGTLEIDESRAFSAARRRERTVSGAFRLRLPYAFAESGGPDVAVRLRKGGPLRIESVSLVPPSEPEDVLRLP